MAFQGFIWPDSHIFHQIVNAYFDTIVITFFIIQIWSTDITDLDKIKFYIFIKKQTDTVDKISNPDTDLDKIVIRNRNTTKTVRIARTFLHEMYDVINHIYDEKLDFVIKVRLTNQTSIN